MRHAFPIIFISNLHRMYSCVSPPLLVVFSSFCELAPGALLIAWGAMLKNLAHAGKGRFERRLIKPKAIVPIGQSFNRAAKHALPRPAPDHHGKRVQHPHAAGPAAGGRHSADSRARSRPGLCHRRSARVRSVCRSCRRIRIRRCCRPIRIRFRYVLSRQG